MQISGMVVTRRVPVPRSVRQSCVMCASTLHEDVTSPASSASLRTTSLGRDAAAGAEAVPVAPTRDRNLGSRVRRFAFFIPAASGAAPELKSVEKTDLRIRGTRFSGGLHMKPLETAELLAFTRPVHFFVAPPCISLYNLQVRCIHSIN